MNEDQPSLLLIYPNNIILVLINYFKKEYPNYFREDIKEMNLDKKFRTAYSHLEYDTPHYQHEEKSLELDNYLNFYDISLISYILLDIIHKFLFKKFQRYLKKQYRSISRFTQIQEQLYTLLAEFSYKNYSEREEQQFTLQNLLEFFGASNITDSTFCLGCGTLLNNPSDLVCDICKNELTPESENKMFNSEELFVIMNLYLLYYLLVKYLEIKKHIDFNQFVDSKQTNLVKKRFRESVKLVYENIHIYETKVFSISDNKSE
ncbi:MAG: hypothetical protein ACXAC7_12430 [Candidatus Hodarchaeales archaeon]|jgi:hypothetical protein